MQNVVPTIYGAELQSALYLGRQHVISPFTTLNEKLGILPGTQPVAGQNPILSLMVAGNGGHDMTAVNGVAYPRPYQHKATDAALYNQVPLVLRALNNDLDAPTRARYALRQQLDVGGTTYIAYWAKRIDLTNVTVSSKIRTATGQVTPAYTETNFTPTAGNLSPTPQLISPNGANIISPDSVVAVSPADIGFSASEVAEYVNAVTILTGTPELAIISEIGLCSGADKSISITTGGSTVSFNESVGAQINSFLACYYPLLYSNSGVSKIVDIGANTPLYNVAQ